MIALAWVMGSLVTYFTIGFAVAAWDMPQLHQRIEDSLINYKPWEYRAKDARWLAFLHAMFWPLCFPYLLTARLADKHNPFLINRELRRREQKLLKTEYEIKELERRMHINKKGDGT